MADNTIELLISLGIDKASAEKTAQELDALNKKFAEKKGLGNVNDQARRQEIEAQLTQARNIISQKARLEKKANDDALKLKKKLVDDTLAAEISAEQFFL